MLKLTEDLIVYRLASGKWDVKDARKRLHKTDFETSHCQLLFELLVELDRNGEAITPDLVIHKLRKGGFLELFGSEESVRDMIQIAESINLEEELSAIKGKARLASKIHFLAMQERVARLGEKLERFRGKQYIGLCQKSLAEIDDRFLGLRKFILLAAAPNVGKTAFTIQIALDVLKNHPEACLVYFSNEMQESDIFIRMFCNLAGMDYRTFVLGSHSARATSPAAYFTHEEHKAIQEATKVLHHLGDRLQIVSSSEIASLDSQKAIHFIREVKERTNTSRVIVVIDYLQVWPTPQDKKFHNELEIDKWRLEEVKKIRDAMNDDPLIVISEARKPNTAEGSWGGDLSDVMGSARATYTPDSVLLLSQLSLEELAKMAYPSDKPKDSDKVEKIKEHLEKKGLSICKLTCPKGRDGMQRFSLYLQFFYRKNIFKSTTEAAIKLELRNSNGK